VGSCGFRRAKHNHNKAVLPGFFIPWPSVPPPPRLPVSGRQSPTALPRRAAAKPTRFCIRWRFFSVVSELPMASGRRAALVALGADGGVWIVDINRRLPTSLRSNGSITPAALRPVVLRHDARVPARFFSPRRRLIVSDAFGASGVCEAPEHPLYDGPHRKSICSPSPAAALPPLRLSPIRRAVWVRCLCILGWYCSRTATLISDCKPARDHFGARLAKMLCPCGVHMSGAPSFRTRCAADPRCAG